MIKECTASVFVFDQHDGVWRVALVRHPRLGEWLPAGGHVEPYETAAEAAIREVAEETGLPARLVPGPGLPAPAGFPHSSVVPPWWVVEMAAGADSHVPGFHVHIDHVFAAVVDSGGERSRAEHEVGWFTEHDVAAADGIGEDSRLQAKELFARIDEIVADERRSA